MAQKALSILRALAALGAAAFGGAIVSNPEQLDGQALDALIRNVLGMIGLGGVAAALSLEKVRAFLELGRQTGKAIFDDSKLPEDMQQAANAAWALRNVHPEAAREAWCGLWDHHAARSFQPEVSDHA